MIHSLRGAARPAPSPKLLLGALAVLLLASGCTSSRFSQVDTRPEPLEPAPSGTVTASQLPPPAAPAAPATPAAPASTEFPTAPEQTQVAALPPQPAPDAPALTAGSVAGVWSATVGGEACRIATPQTKFGQGFRAGPLRCPAPIDGVKSWNVSGSQLTLYDDSGAALAQLYASGPEAFSGQTSGGMPISLTR